MTITINLTRKTFAILLLTALLCMGVTLAYAAHDDPNIIHACVNNSSGTIKIVQDASECATNEAALALASESATDGLQAALEAENTARHAADDYLQTQVTDALNKANLALATANSTQTAVDALDNLLMHFSRSGNDVYIIGANLHVVNGTGTTASANSLGNLIIGYNEPEPGAINDRSGSHMLVVGSRNNYSRFGGIVVGRNNEASGAYASVSGGTNNVASASFASVSGGDTNVASGQYASVCGGYGNEASGMHASVSGGYGNEASANYATVSGGGNNTASGTSATVSGGYQRQAINPLDWVAGGLFEDQ